MRRLLKWVSATLVLAILLLSVFILTFDLDDYRPTIQSVASKAIGLDVEIDGDLTLWPSFTPTIVVENAQIKNPQWASRPYLAEIGRIELTTDLFALLKDKIVITSLSIEDASFHIERSVDSQYNWQFWGQSISGDKETTSVVNDVSITDSQLKVLGMGDQDFKVTIHNAKIASAPDSIFQLDMQGLYQDVPIDVEIKSGKLTALHESGALPVSIILDAGVNNASFKGVIERHAQGSVMKGDIDIATEDAESLASLVSAPVTVSGALDLSAKVNVDEEIVSLAQIVAAGTLEYEDHQLVISKGSAEFGPDAQVSMNLDGSLSNIPFILQMQGGMPEKDMPVIQNQWLVNVLLKTELNQLSVNGNITDTSSGNVADVNIDLSGKDSGELAKLINKDLPDLANYNMQARLDGNQNQYELDIVSGLFDKTRLKGSVKVDAADKPVKLTTDLVIDRINLSKKHKDNKSSNMKGKKRSYLDETISLNLPDDMEIDYSLVISSIAGLPFELTDVNAKGSVTKSGVKVTTSKMKTPGGAITSTLDYLVDNTMPKVKLDLSTGKHDVYRLLGKAEWSDINKLKLGKASLQVETKGHSLRDFINRGRLKFKARKVQVEYIDNEKRELLLDKFQANSINGKPLQISLDGKYQGTPLNSNITLDGLINRLNHIRPMPVTVNAAISGATLKVKGTVQDIKNRSGLNLSANISGQQLHDLTPVIGKDLPNIGPYDFSAKLNDNANEYMFKDLVGHIGDSDISGTINITTQANTLVPVAIAADLHSNKLSVDDFLESEDQPVSVDEANKHIHAISLPTELMRGRDIQLKLAADVLEMKGVNYTGLNTIVSSGNGIFLVEPFKVNLSGGDIKGRLRSQLIPSGAVTSIKLEGEDIDYGALFKSLDVTQDMSGLADIDVDISGKGMDTFQIMSSGNGHIRITSGPGEIDQTKIDLWADDIIRVALTSAFKPANKAEVNCMVGHFEIKDGEVSTDSLLLDTSRITVAGTGQLNLANEELNLVLTPKPKNPSLVSLAKPVRLTGNFMDPKVKETKLENVWKLGGILAGLANPAALILIHGNIGTLGANPCEAALQKRDLEEKKAAKKGDTLINLPGRPVKRILDLFKSKPDKN